MANNIVSIKEKKRGRRIDYDWGLQLVLKKRKALLRSVPLMSDELTEIDKWLSTQPGLPLKVYCDVWQRAMYIDFLLFDDLTPGQKHHSLIRLRDHYREFQKIPPSLQKKLWPMWERWQQEFDEQEARDVSA